jgi:hypothetical protein
MEVKIMAQQSGLVKSPFTIDKNTTGSTWLTADLVTSATWQQILEYAVPLGMAVEVTPINYHFGDYNATDTTTAITAGMTRILKQNANGTESREIWSGSNAIFKDLGDEFQRPKLRTPVVVNASQKLVVQVYSLGTTLDSVSSNYYIECIQYYEEI